MPTDLILALDMPTREAAAPILRQLRGSLRWVKIGLQLFTAHGPDYVRAVADEGFDIFLDLKLHDIPNTVARAVESLAALPVGMLTLHTCGGREMMLAADDARRAAKPGLLLLGVTVLTSMDAAGLAETGVAGAPGEQVSRLGRLAIDSGLRGLVCSPLEVAALRRELPADVRLVTPGIRFGGGAGGGGAGEGGGGAGGEAGGRAGGDDQKRIMTPAGAARAGASYIVVGRPILKAPSPAEAAAKILAELRGAG